VNALLNRTVIGALLTVIAAALTASGLLPHAVSANHIDTAATIVLAIATAYSHGHATGAAAVKSAVATVLGNKPLLVSLLTGLGAVLTATGLYRGEVSSGHVAEIATALLAIVAAFNHGQSNGAAANAS
jgi:hypothetical protein